MRVTVGVDEINDAGVQRQVAVLVELAEGYVQPVRVTDQDDRVGSERGELPDP